MSPVPACGEERALPGGELTTQATRERPSGPNCIVVISFASVGERRTPVRLRLARFITEIYKVGKK